MSLFRLPLLLATLGLLAACGADGAPEAPAPGVAISGTAKMGIVSRP
jgi:predicted small lipoprotein YifL